VPLFVVTGYVRGRELPEGVGGLNELQYLPVRGGLVWRKQARSVVVGLSEEVDQLHHAYHFVLGELAVQRERIGCPLLVSYLDLDLFSQA